MVPFIGLILLGVLVPFCRSADFSFIREPESEIIEDGHAIFMCEPSQSSATVQWFRDDQELSANSSNVVTVRKKRFVLFCFQRPRFIHHRLLLIGRET